MKARVKATGKIVEVECVGISNNLHYEVYKIEDLDFDNFDTPDYWTRLEHQYAGMAMQGMLSNTSLITVLFDATKDHDELLKEIIICSHEYARALVKKMKETK